MKKNRILAFVTCIIVSAGLILGGCGSSDSSKSASAADGSSSGETLMGMVVSIDKDNSTITISSAGGGFSGNMPEGFDPGNMPEGFSGTEMPEGFDPGNMPEGFSGTEMPEGFNPGNKPEFNGTEMPERPDGAGAEAESTTYNVTKDSVLKDQNGNKVALSGIAPNVFVQYTVDGDNLLTLTVTDMDTSNFKNPPQGGNAPGQDQQ